jgi:hypothetical protein
MQLHDPAVYMKNARLPSRHSHRLCCLPPLSGCTGQKWRRDHGRLLLHACYLARSPLLRHVLWPFVLRRFRSGGHLYQRAKGNWLVFSPAHGRYIRCPLARITPSPRARSFLFKKKRAVPMQPPFRSGDYFVTQTFEVFMPFSASVRVLNTLLPTTVVVVVGFWDTMVHFLVVLSCTM